MDYWNTPWLPNFYTIWCYLSSKCIIWSTLNFFYYHFNCLKCYLLFSLASGSVKHLWLFCLSIPSSHWFQPYYIGRQQPYKYEVVTLCENKWSHKKERQIVFPAGLNCIIRHQRSHTEESHYECHNHRNSFYQNLHFIRYGVIQPQDAKPQETKLLCLELVQLSFF